MESCHLRCGAQERPEELERCCCGVAGAGWERNTGHCLALEGVLSNTKGLPSHTQKVGCEAPPKRVEAAPPAWGPLESSPHICRWWYCDFHPHLTGKFAEAQSEPTTQVHTGVT